MGTLRRSGREHKFCVSVVPKVNLSECSWTFKRHFLAQDVFVYACMFTSMCLIVCYFLYSIFTTIAAVDRVFICGSCSVQAFFSILLL